MSKNLGNIPKQDKMTEEQEQTFTNGINKGRKLERNRIADLLVNTAHTDEYCDFLHFCYEQEAERYGWKTQERTRVAWKDLPIENQNTMRMAVFELVLYMVQDILGEEEWAERVDTANPKRSKVENK